jgi:hypothetical protein
VQVLSGSLPGTKGQHPGDPVGRMSAPNGQPPGAPQDEVR